MKRRVNAHAIGRRTRSPLRSALAITASVGLAGGLCAAVATAAVTSPTEAAVYRGGSVPIVESVGGRRLDFAGNELPTGGSNTSCGVSKLANPQLTVNDPATTASMPHTRVKVFGPGDLTTPLANALSPERTVSVPGALIPVYDRGGPFSFNWTIPDEAVPGIYTIVVTVTDRKKTTTTGTNSTSPCTSTTTAETRTVEFRPWVNKFKDFFGNGDVSFNLSPREFAATISGKTTPIIGGGSDRMRVFAMADPESLMLPDDPGACGDDPTGCLPAGVTECAPSDTDEECEPRVVVINWRQDADRVVEGVFDLESKAFIAVVSYEGNRGVLLSLGDEGNAAVAELLGQLGALAAEQGVDLLSLLQTTVKVTLNNGGEATVAEVSVLRALQIYTQNPGASTSVYIEGPLTATVGLFAHSYSFTGQPKPAGVAEGTTTACNGPLTCVAPSNRYTSRSGFGYSVAKSDLLPDLPKVGLPALPPIPGLPTLPVDPATATGLLSLASAVVPTKFFNVSGKWTTGAHSLRVAVDTNPGEPHGLPVWVAPLHLLPEDPAAITADPTGTALGVALLGLLGLGAPSFQDRAMDFLGTASWRVSETCTATACGGTGSMTGLGVGIFSDAPLPVRLRDIPLMWDENPAAQQIVAAINQAIADGQTAANEQVAALLADPTVQAVLEALLGSLPALPELPETPALPDLGSVPLP